MESQRRRDSDRGPPRKQNITYEDYEGPRRRDDQRSSYGGHQQSPSPAEHQQYYPPLPNVYPQQYDASGHPPVPPPPHGPNGTLPSRTPFHYYGHDFTPVSGPVNYSYFQQRPPPERTYRGLLEENYYDNRTPLYPLEPPLASYPGPSHQIHVQPQPRLRQSHFRNSIGRPKPLISSAEAEDADYLESGSDNSSDSTNSESRRKRRRKTRRRSTKNIQSRESSDEYDSDTVSDEIPSFKSKIKKIFKADDKPKPRKKVTFEKPNEGMERNARALEDTIKIIDHLGIGYVVPKDCWEDRKLAHAYNKIVPRFEAFDLLYEENGMNLRLPSYDAFKASIKSGRVYKVSLKQEQSKSQGKIRSSKLKRLQAKLIGGAEIPSTHSATISGKENWPRISYGGTHGEFVQDQFMHDGSSFSKPNIISKLISDKGLSQSNSASIQVTFYCCHFYIPFVEGMTYKTVLGQLLEKVRNTVRPKDISHNAYTAILRSDQSLYDFIDLYDDSNGFKIPPTAWTNTIWHTINLTVSIDRLEQGKSDFKARKSVRKVLKRGTVRAPDAPPGTPPVLSENASIIIGGRDRIPAPLSTDRRQETTRSRHATVEDGSSPSVQGINENVPPSPMPVGPISIVIEAANSSDDSDEVSSHISSGGGNIDAKALLDELRFTPRVSAAEHLAMFETLFDEVYPGATDNLKCDAFARSIASAHEWFNGFELTPFEWLEDKEKQTLLTYEQLKADFVEDWGTKINGRPEKPSSAGVPIETKGNMSSYGDHLLSTAARHPPPLESSNPKTPGNMQHMSGSNFTSLATPPAVNKVQPNFLKTSAELEPSSPISTKYNQLIGPMRQFAAPEQIVEPIPPFESRQELKDTGLYWVQEYTPRNGPLFETMMTPRLLGEGARTRPKHAFVSEDSQSDHEASGTRFSYQHSTAATSPISGRALSKGKRREEKSRSGQGNSESFISTEKPNSLGEVQSELIASGQDSAIAGFRNDAEILHIGSGFESDVEVTGSKYYEEQDSQTQASLRDSIASMVFKEQPLTSNDSNDKPERKEKKHTKSGDLRSSTPIKAKYSKVNLPFEGKKGTAKTRPLVSIEGDNIRPERRSTVEERNKNGKTWVVPNNTYRVHVRINDESQTCLITDFKEMNEEQLKHIADGCDDWLCRTCGEMQDPATLYHQKIRGDIGKICDIFYGLAPGCEKYSFTIHDSPASDQEWENPLESFYRLLEELEVIIEGWPFSQKRWMELFNMSMDSRLDSVLTYLASFKLEMERLRRTLKRIPKHHITRRSVISIQDVLYELKAFIEWIKRRLGESKHLFTTSVQSNSNKGALGVEFSNSDGELYKKRQIPHIKYADNLGSENSSRSYDEYSNSSSTCKQVSKAPKKHHSKKNVVKRGKAVSTKDEIEAHNTKTRSEAMEASKDNCTLPVLFNGEKKLARLSMRGGSGDPYDPEGDAVKGHEPPENNDNNEDLRGIAVLVSLPTQPPPSPAVASSRPMGPPPAPKSRRSPKPGIQRKSTLTTVEDYKSGDEGYGGRGENPETSTKRRENSATESFVIEEIASTVTGLQNPSTVLTSFTEDYNPTSRRSNAHRISERNRLTPRRTAPPPPPQATPVSVELEELTSYDNPRPSRVDRTKTLLNEEREVESSSPQSRSYDGFEPVRYEENSRVSNAEAVPFPIGNPYLGPYAQPYGYGNSGYYHGPYYNLDPSKNQGPYYSQGQIEFPDRRLLHPAPPGEEYSAQLPNGHSSRLTSANYNYPPPLQLPPPSSYNRGEVNPGYTSTPYNQQSPPPLPSLPHVSLNQPSSSSNWYGNNPPPSAQRLSQPPFSSTSHHPPLQLLPPPPPPPLPHPGNTYNTATPYYQSSYYSNLPPPPSQLPLVLYNPDGKPEEHFEREREQYDADQETGYSTGGEGPFDFRESRPYSHIPPPPYRRTSINRSSSKIGSTGAGLSTFIGRDNKRHTFQPRKKVANPAAIYMAREKTPATIKIGPHGHQNLTGIEKKEKRKKLKKGDFYVSMIICGRETRMKKGDVRLFRLKLNKRKIDDYQLFSELRKKYYQVRGAWMRFSFTEVVDIRLAEYTVRDISGSNTSNIFYDLNSQPIDLEEYVGRNQLVYKFHHPSSGKRDNFWVDWLSSLKYCRPLRMNKKKLGKRAARRTAKADADRIGTIAGQGLVFTEGWAVRRIAYYCVALMMGSLGLSIGWSVKFSVEQGFALGGFMITMSSLILAMIAALSTMGG